MTQSAFDIIDDKYGFTQQPDLAIVYEPDPAVQPHEPEDATPAAGDPQTLTDWKQSEPVKLLSAFLKEFIDQGIYLRQTEDGFPILSFNPGLKQESYDPDRWAHATHAADLIDHAREDLKELISNGALNLHVYKGVL